MKATSAARAGSMAMKQRSATPDVSASNDLRAASKQTNDDRDAEPVGDLARDVDGHARWRRRAALRENGVAEIDRGAQRPGRREVAGNG